MIVYVGLILYCIVLGFFLDKIKSNNKLRPFIILLVFLGLFIIPAIRYEVGTDYVGTYQKTYYQILNNYEQIRIDFGFFLLNKIIIALQGNYKWVFSITSFIIAYFSIKSIDEQSQIKKLSLIIYICGTFFFFAMNGVRQAISLSIFYYSLKYIEKKDFKKYLLLNVIGTSFHTSAIIFIPMYFLLDKNIGKKKMLISILIVAIISPLILPYINNMLINTKYGVYINNVGFEALGKFNLASIINAIIFICYLYFTDAENNKNRLYLNIHFIGVIVSIFLLYIPLANRLFISFKYVEFLSVANLVKNNKIIKNKRILEFIVVIFYIMYFVYSVYINNYNSVLPYKTIFS